MSKVRQRIAPDRLAMRDGSPQAEKMDENESPSNKSIRESRAVSTPLDKSNKLVEFKSFTIGMTNPLSVLTATLTST